MFIIEEKMSAGDYTSHRRLIHTNKLPCNTVPGCHYVNSCELTVPSNSLQNHVNYCVTNGKLITAAQYGCCNICGTSLTSTGACNTCSITTTTTGVNQKYITKTIKAYKVLPVKNATVGFLVEPSLPFTIGQSISCSIMDADNNYFNGTVLDYDKDIGFISLGNIDNITGSFSETVVYNINLILFDPEVSKLKHRMEMLFKHLFQVDLATTPDYNPVAAQLIQFDRHMYNIFMYLFNYNIRIEDGYAVTEAHISKLTDDLYLYFFDVSLDRSLDFNPNPHHNVDLSNLKNKINQLYIYLFSVNLEQMPYFNPN